MPLTQIGYYRIDRMLGAGGMGAVHEATHTMTGRRVALKTLRSELADRPDLNARFFNEARTMSFLEHPGIVRVFDVGRTDDGTAYMVMELCVGPTLGTAMRELLSLPARIGLLAPVADALAYAHTQGVIHRDLKPDNVIVTQGPTGPVPRVLDFGIAKVLEGASAAGSPFSVKTRTGTAMGTPLYMSPEQCRGMGGITRATDVYSLGIMLYEAIAGHVPFNGGVGEVIVQHLTTPVPEFDDETVVDTRAQVKATVYAMLEKEAASRPDMAEVARALHEYLDEPHPHSLVPQSSMRRVVAEPNSGAVTVAAAVPVVTASAPQSPKLAPAAATVPGKNTRSRLPLLLGLVVGAAIAGGVGWALWMRPPAVSPPIPTTGHGPQTDHHVAPHDGPAVAGAKTWHIESVPSGADVFGADGSLLGRTPYVADAALAKGVRTLYVRKAGYRDELVKYDPSGLSDVKLKVRMKIRTVPPLTHPGKQSPSTDDDFDVQPVR